MSGEYHNDYRNDYRGGGDRGGDRGGRGRGRGGYGDRGGDRGRGRPRRQGIPLSALDQNLTSVSHKIIGIATEIHSTLGPGFDRAVYVEAFKNEMTAAGINFTAGKAYDVSYKERVVGKTTADFVIENLFIVTISDRSAHIGGFDRSQLRGQLKAADLTLGLIVSFGGRRLKDGLVRVLNIEKLKRDHPGQFDLADDEGGESSNEGGGDHGGGDSEWDDHSSSGSDTFGSGRSVNFDDRV